MANQLKKCAFDCLAESEIFVLEQDNDTKEWNIPFLGVIIEIHVKFCSKLLF